MKMNKKQRRVVRKMLFPVIALVMMTATMAIATERYAASRLPISGTVLLGYRARYARSTTASSPIATAIGNTMTVPNSANRAMITSHRPATVPALRQEAMRRNGSRTAGTGLADAVRRSVGSTSG